MEPMSWMDYNHPGWHWYQVISWKISRRIIISPSRAGSAIIYRDVFDIDVRSLCKSESRIDYDAVSTVTGPCAQSAWSAKVIKKGPVMPIKGCHLMVCGFKNLKASHILKWLFCRKEICLSWIFFSWTFCWRTPHSNLYTIFLICSNVKSVPPTRI